MLQIIILYTFLALFKTFVCVAFFSLSFILFQLFKKGASFSADFILGIRKNISSKTSNNIFFSVANFLRSSMNLFNYRILTYFGSA